ncbi:MAG: hypothetical protein XD73_0500, partial [Anaerolinea thermophila]
LVRLTHMKKSVFLLLCLFAFMVACTQAGNVSQAEIVTQSPQPVASATPLPTQIHATATPIPAETDGVVLQFWHPWTGNKASSIAALVAEFNRSNEQGIFIEEKSVADENFLMSEVLDALEQENMPDILAAPSRFNRSLYQQGVVLALDDLIANPETGISAEQRRTFPTVFWDEDVLEGVRYAVPAEYNLNILFYNQSWAQELGFENPPASSEEFLNQACAAARFNAFDANDENNGTGGWIYNNEPVTMLSWMQAFGGGEIPADLNRGIEFNTAENQDAMEFLRTIYQLDCAWTGKESTPYAYFARRYALFYSGSVADWQRQLALDEIEGNTDEWIIIPYPGQDGDPIVNSATLSYAITRSEPEREQAAWVFIRWMLSDDVQIAISEETYSIPVTLAIVPELADMMDQHPAWQRLVQYLPLSRPLPAVSSWNILASLLKDVGWQVSQFNVAAADIPTILENLDTIANEVIHDN